MALVHTKTYQEEEGEDENAQNVDHKKLFDKLTFNLW